WYLRDSHCRLVPGDLPLGYRLPLASQPWVTAAEYPFIHPTDPNQDLPELPGTEQLARHGEPATEQERVPEIDKSADWLTGTAFCAEAREGRLYLFMPPL
ncbi:transglutaminase family protein, partial [Pseudomonas brassicacearum]|uniref:transglutaminase family protein n=1 Tax=Pseudomonas brassicacearum TaxID=930166 RepID=UPI0011CE651E